MRAEDEGSELGLEDAWARAARPPAAVLPWRALALLALAAFGGGCRSGEAASHNLDVVLSSEDRLRYVGNLRGWLESLLVGWIDTSLLEQGSWLVGSDTDPIADPTDVAIENLIRLAESSDGPPRWREAEEVRHFARYAAACPAGLARERALIELAEHGQRLGLVEPFRPPTRPANAEELRVRIDGLVDGARGLMAAGADAGETELADFAAACEVLGAAELDLQGGRRALAAVAPFLRSSRLQAPAREALVALSESLQRRLVGEALAKGLVDPLPYVRAAALRTCAAVYGDAFLVEATFALGARPGQELLPEAYRAEASRFGLVTDPVEVGDARIEVCRLLVERGLPEPARGSDARSRALRFGLFAVLIQVATRYDLFESATRTHAMLALDAVSGAELGTIREEEWDAWWRRTGPGLYEDVLAGQRAPSGAADGGARPAPRSGSGDPAGSDGPPGPERLR